MSVAAPERRSPAPAGPRQARAVRIRAGVAIGVVTAVVAVLGLLIAWPVGVGAAVVVASGGWLGLVRPRATTAEQRALGRVGPIRPADVHRDARLLNLIEGLAASAGVGRADCFVLDAPGCNALVVGKDPRQGSLVVTAGLTAVLSRMELEAVVAHCLCRLRDGGVAGVTTALAFGSTPLLTGSAMGGDDLAAADDEAASLTRYPPGLVGALRAIEAHGASVRVPDTALEPLWMVRPGDPDALAYRVERLLEL